MPNQIERDVYVLRNTLKNPISYVRGTDLLPIIFHFRDFTIPSTADARVFVAKPDGNAVYGNAAINGNDVTVSIQQQMFLVLGTTLMQLEILDGNETLLTFSQPVIVEPNLKAGDFPESITEIKFLDDAIEQAQEAANNASKAVENANNAIETANVAISSANDAAQNANNTAQELLDRADQGEFDGPQGPSGTITVGTVKTVQPEQNATVKNIGTSNNAVFDFEIPRGSDGMTDLVARYEDTSEYTATPTSDAPIVINDLSGKTQQTQTNGYQLFDASRIKSKTQGGATVTNNNDGSFTISGSGNLSEAFIYIYDINSQTKKKLFKADTPIKGLREVSQVITRPFFRLVLKKNGEFVREIFNNETITEDEFNDDTVGLDFRFYGENGKEIVTGTVKPMAYQDGDGTWEPFTDGVASPSPDWEQRIAGVGDSGFFDGSLQKGYYNTSGVYTSADNYVCTVNKIECKQSDNINVELETSATSIIVSFFQSSGTFISQQTGSGTSLTATAPANAGYCMISINRASIEPQTAGHICVKVNGKYASRVESHGANLFDASKLPTKTQGGATITNNGDGSFTISGSGNLRSDFYNDYNFDIEDFKQLFKPGNIYIKGGINLGIYTELQINYQEGNLLIKGNGTGNLLAEKLNSVTRVVFVFYGRAGNIIPNLTFKPIIYQDGDGTWQPYRHTSIQFPLTNPLYDGDKVCYVKPGESYIDENGDKVVADRMLYGHYHENEKAVLDGSEDEAWLNESEGTNVYKFKINISKKLVQSSEVTNILKQIPSVVMGDEEGIATNYLGLDIYIALDKKRLSDGTTESLKTWLQSNNLEVVYKLEQPYFEPFEDQTPFYNLRSFDDLTYIYSDDPLNPTLTVDVAKNQTGGYIFESLAQAMKNAQKAEAMKSFESRLQALESQAVENI